MVFGDNMTREMRLARYLSPRVQRQSERERDGRLCAYFMELILKRCIQNGKSDTSAAVHIIKTVSG